MNRSRRLLLFLLLFPATVFSEIADVDRIRAWLDGYIGSWKGEVVVEDADGAVLRKIPAAAEYWRDGEGVRALTAFEIDGRMTFVEARNYIKNGLLFADVTQAGKTLVYRGYLGPVELLWVPYDAELSTERRMKEWFTEEDGKEILYVEGLERLTSEKGQAVVRLRARMERR